MKRVHFIDNYLMNPQHPVTIHLIGAGGTGSQVMTCLARLDVTLKALNHPGLFVTVYDPDTVTESNIGRQLFGESDIGMNKAVCLTSRINLFFGNDWKAETRLYPSSASNAVRADLANLTITCTDNVKSRINLGNIFCQTKEQSYRDYQTPLYWMDFGNTQTSGQVIIGTVSEQIKQPESKMFETVRALKTVTQYVNYDKLKDEDSGPSCSLAEALSKQDLFINSTLAQFGCNLLWRMFRTGMLDFNGLFLNLETLKVNPIAV